jgi:DNA-binding GntR family transcriptional regulator
VDENVTAGGAYFRKQDWAYEQVRAQILSGEIPAGRPIGQEDLAESLNISRIPLREALSRLKAEGWLEGLPHRRMVVPELSLDGARDIYAGRAALESTLARFAAAAGPHASLTAARAALGEQRAAFDAGDLARFRSLDRDFHMGLYALADMPQTMSAASQLYALGERYVGLYLGTVDRSGESLAEHATILEAIEAGDTATAERLTREHISRGLVVLEDFLLPESSDPSPESDR